MPESYQWQSAFATLGIEARALATVADAGVILSERRAGTQLAIRGDASNGDFTAAVADVLGVELPLEPVKPAARDFSKHLFEHGVFAQAIAFPTVPRGTARIRCMVSAAHSPEDIQTAVDTFVKVGNTIGVLS